MCLSLDCCNRIPLTGWFINNRHSFLTVLEAKSETKVLADSVTGEPTSWFLHSHFFLHPYVAERVRDLSGAPFISALIPFMRAPPS